jgi:hypothetical protein
MRKKTLFRGWNFLERFCLSSVSRGMCVCLFAIVGLGELELKLYRKVTSAEVFRLTSQPNTKHGGLPARYGDAWVPLSLTNVSFVKKRSTEEHESQATSLSSKYKHKIIFLYNIGLGCAALRCAALRWTRAAD